MAVSLFMASLCLASLSDMAHFDRKHSRFYLKIPLIVVIKFDCCHILMDTAFGGDVYFESST